MAKIDHILVGLLFFGKQGKKYIANSILIHARNAVSTLWQEVKSAWVKWTDEIISLLKAVFDQNYICMYAFSKN